MTIGEFKARLPEALEAVARGENIHVTKGRARVPVATLTGPKPKKPKPAKRKLGMLKGKCQIAIKDDWAMTEEELLGL